MRMIEVTERHIGKGYRDNCALCPIALALMESDPGLLEVNVSYGSATLFFRDKEKAKEDWPLPVEAIEFYRAFDRGLPVKPFSFDLHKYKETAPGDIDMLVWP